ncbi:MAG: lamin tail domain-containing protein, partial [Candidatus Uhrbacteria bacterium]
DSGDDAGDQQDDTGDTGDDGSENNAASPGGGSPTITAPSWPTHVKLNEFVADPAAGDEWIEFVNTGSVAVNLADWVVEDGAERRTILSGAIGVGGFFVLEAPKGQLNNSGDRIVLMHPDGTVVDTVTYGDWDDGKPADNAPNASDPASVARVVDGYDTDVDRFDWVYTETPTPGAANIVSSVPQDAEAVATNAAQIRAIIVVNELFVNPEKSDAEREYIELANIGTVDADLAGWRIADALGTEYVVDAADGATVLGAGAVLTFDRSRTGIALNNTGGDTVRVFKPSGERASATTSYSDSAPEGQSWARDEYGRWHWTIRVTPGAENIIEKANVSPDAVIDVSETATVGAIISLDASDSADPDREALTYLWNFGDPRTEADVSTKVLGQYVYDTPGTYEVTLTVTDERGGTATTTHRLVVDRVPSPPSVGEQEVALKSFSPSRREGELEGVGYASTSLRLSELLPNPEGSDSEEWMEIENTGDGDVSLEGWELVVIGPRTQRTALPNVMVPANGFAVVHRADTSFSLRNDGATVELYNSGGALIDSTAYGHANEGTSFARVNELWGWTTPTPGVENAEFVALPNGGQVLGVRIAGTVDVRELQELDELALGEDVVVRGSVTAPRGVLGTQIFYIADATGGVQVFVGDRAIPDIIEGDVVEVHGELRSVQDELRVGVSDPADVRIADRGEIVTPTEFRIAEITDKHLGELIAIAGEVMEVRGNTIYVDDGSDEVRVALPDVPTDDQPRIAEGEAIEVVGVLSRTKSGFRVRPRGIGDVIRIAAAPPLESASEIPQAARSGIEALVLVGGAVAVLSAVLLRRRATHHAAGH